MPRVSIDANWTYRSFRTVVIENRRLRAMVLPELGGKIWSLVDKTADREVLWHNPRLPPRPAHYGASYDDWFCGGWDELFPNDAPATIGGDPYPDHGEWWSMPFEWRIDEAGGVAALHMERAGVVTPTRVQKTISLSADEPLLRFGTTIVNDGPQPLDYLWKLHPALAISPASRIDLPARRVLIDEGFRDRLGPQAESFIWPHAIGRDGVSFDMRQIPPPDAATCDFFYATELDAGWCALTDAAALAGFGLAFDPQVFSSVWVFGAYGGWRGLYTAILEPSTGYPYRLEDAIARGTASRIAAGGRLSTEVTAVLYHGVDAVTHIGADGSVAYSIPT